MRALRAVTRLPQALLFMAGLAATATAGAADGERLTVFGTGASSSMDDGGGLLSEIVSCGAEKAGLDVSIIEVPINRAARGLESGTADATLPGATMLPSSLANRVTVTPITRIGLTFVYDKTRTPQLANYKELKDLRGLKIGLFRNIPGGRYRDAGAEPIYMDTQDQKVAQLLAGRVDVISGGILATAILFGNREMAGRFNATPPQRWADLGLAWLPSNKDATARLELFARGFETCIRSGDYYRILARYYGSGNIPAEAALDRPMQGYTSASPDWTAILTARRNARGQIIGEGITAERESFSVPR